MTNEHQPANQGRGVGESRESRMVVIERDADGTPTVWCDPEIVDLVTALNAGGIPTVASCSGHGVILGNIALRDGRELHISPNHAAARELEAAIAALTQPKGVECTRSSIFSEQCYCRTCVPTPTNNDFLKLLTLVVDGAKALGHHSTLRETDQATIDYWENYVSAGTEKIKATLAALSLPRQSEAEPYVPGDGEVLVTVSGLTGSGKSGVAGEIEILCKALGLQVEWKDSGEEKRMTYADWTHALELYKPRVTIIEQNIPRKP
jgi:hypothetical protein